MLQTQWGSRLPTDYLVRGGFQDAGDMSLLLSRGGRKGPIACLIALIFIFALYQLGIICGSTKYAPTAVMVSKEVRQFRNESVISRVRFEVKSLKARSASSNICRRICALFRENHMWKHKWGGYPSSKIIFFIWTGNFNPFCKPRLVPLFPLRHDNNNNN